jgi:hypothetical protein
MKDGSAHPDGPEWVYCGEDGSQSPLWGVVPTVKFYELGDDPEHRAAADLERIANRYREDLPDRKSANAVEILEAARLLYIELYRDCGTEARRQKLVGADLMVRWIEKQIGERLTQEELDRWRAYVVEDLIELGITRKSEGDELTVFEVAEAIARQHNWPLGSASAIKGAYYRWKKNPDWLASGTVASGYRKITREDINAGIK